jgi:hypothetical protein
VSGFGASSAPFGEYVAREEAVAQFLSGLSGSDPRGGCFGPVRLVWAGRGAAALGQGRGPVDLQDVEGGGCEFGFGGRSG